MNKNRKIAFIGIGIALYAVLSAFVMIPIINRIKLDLGYTVFGIYLNKFGIISTLVGVFGCIIGNLLKGGSFPIAWAMGQLFIGLTLGYLLNKTENIYLKILYCLIFSFIGIGLIKTVIEVLMYKFPFNLKLASNSVAYIADVIPLIIGVLLSKKLKVLDKERI